MISLRTLPSATVHSSASSSIKTATPALSGALAGYALITQIHSHNENSIQVSSHEKPQRSQAWLPEHLSSLRAFGAFSNKIFLPGKLSKNLSQLWNSSFNLSIINSSQQLLRVEGSSQIPMKLKYRNFTSHLVENHCTISDLVPSSRPSSLIAFCLHSYCVSNSPSPDVREATGHMNGPGFISEHDETEFFPPRSIAIKAKLKHPCKSELFHLRSFCVMLKWMFLISGDGTAKHVSSSSSLAQHNKSWAMYVRLCVSVCADTRLMKAWMIRKYSRPFFGTLTPKHVEQSCHFPIENFHTFSHRSQPNARPLFVPLQRAFLNANEAFSVTEVCLRIIAVTIGRCRGLEFVEFVAPTVRCETGRKKG